MEPIDIENHSDNQSQMDDTGSTGKNMRRVALTALLLFCIPLCIAVLMAFAAKRVSPAHISQQQGIAEETLRASTVPKPPDSGAGVDELMQYRGTLRQRGENIDLVNLRIWAAATKESAPLFSIEPPSSGVWEWSVTADGSHALAISRSESDSVHAEAALYSFESEDWLWHKNVPWPENFESPWIFNRHLVVRSSKNGRRFAMELDAYGNILAMDSLADGPPFNKEQPPLYATLQGNFVAERHNGYFMCEDKNILCFYSKPSLPGLHQVRAFAEMTKHDQNYSERRIVSGNSLLSIIAADGAINIFDTFTGEHLERAEAWPSNSNTIVRGVQSDFHGSEICVHLTTSFNFDQPIEREWSVTYKPHDELIDINTTNPPALPNRQRQLRANIIDYNLDVSAADSYLTFAYTNTTETVTIDLTQHTEIECVIDNIMLLENRRHLLIECDVVDFILDLHALRHYGDLLDRIHHCNRILAENSYAELMRANLINKDLRDVPEYLRSSDNEDNFNYEMLDFYVDYMDPRTLEPPALPSILSLQAEYFAIHQAWYYAARKLEQLAALQEHDHRAPKANQLLCVRYNMLSDNIKKAKAGCDNGLNKLFYDYSDFNRMVRWQFLKRLFKQ